MRPEIRQMSRTSEGSGTHLEGRSHEKPRCRSLDPHDRSGHSAASAQTTEGSIRGYVRDEQGGALPGVTVTAKSPAAPRPHVAVSDGRRVLPAC